MGATSAAEDGIGGNRRLDDPREAGCCPLNLIKFAFSVYCVIYFISGLLQLCSGVWTLYFHSLHLSSILSLSPSPVFPLAAYIVLTSAITISIASIVGVWGAKKEKRGAVISSLLLMFLSLLLLLCSALLWLLLFWHSQSELDPAMNEAVNHKYGVEDRVTEAVDQIQQQLKCCGSHFYTEWSTSAWYTTASAVNSVPESCCKTPSYGCGKSTHPSNIPYTGCIHSLSEGLGRWSWGLACVSLGCSLLTGAGIIYASILSVKLRKLRIYQAEREEMKRRRLRRPPSGGLFDRPRSVKLAENNNGGYYAPVVGNGSNGHHQNNQACSRSHLIGNFHR